MRSLIARSLPNRRKKLGEEKRRLVESNRRDGRSGRKLQVCRKKLQTLLPKTLVPVRISENLDYYGTYKTSKTLLHQKNVHLKW